jgi:hypothetical protein
LRCWTWTSTLVGFEWGLRHVSIPSYHNPQLTHSPAYLLSSPNHPNLAVPRTPRPSSLATGECPLPCHTARWAHVPPVPPGICALSWAASVLLGDCRPPPRALPLGSCSESCVPLLPCPSPPSLRVGAQDDALLFQAKKDATWADLGGYTDW